MPEIANCMAATFAYSAYRNLAYIRIIAIFTSDLRHQKVDFEMPANPLTDTDTAWILLLQRVYAPPAVTVDG